MVFNLLKKFSLLALTACLLSFSGVQAQSETSYVIVHAHNPEGVEIASIEGMSSNSVEIYDGDSFIGYGAYNAETHNKPIAISPGIHNIRVKFNGITLEQSVKFNPGETEILVFAFTRETYDIRSWLNNISINDIVELNKEYPLSIAPTIKQDLRVLKILDGNQYLLVMQSLLALSKRNISVNNGSAKPCYSGGSFSGLAKVSFLNGIYNVNFQLSVNYQAEAREGDEAIIINVGDWAGFSTYFEGHGITILTPPSLPNVAFKEWHVQSIIDGTFPGIAWNKRFTVIPAGVFSNHYELQKINTTIVIYDAITLFGSYEGLGEVRLGGLGARLYYSGTTASFNFTDSYSEQGEIKQVLMSSVPYDLTGTGVKDLEEKWPPLATFFFFPEKARVGEEIAFDASASNDPDGEIIKYEWDFGDETTGEGIKVTHIYAKAEEYKVALTVTDNDGLTDSTELSLMLKSSFDLEILDGVDFSAGREVSNDPERLVSIKGAAVEGAVTDGVTRLLLKVNTDSSETVTFSLEGTDNPNEDGVLRSIDGFQQGSSITVNTVNTSDGEKAFAIYQAPENFVRSGYAEDTGASERKITLKVEPNSGLPIQEEIKLLRPPLILVHGLWSGPEMWDGFSNSLRNKLPGISIFIANYRATNASYFNVNKEKVYDYISEARKQLRSEGIAMVQADIFGHSMGGVLGRIWSGGRMWSEIGYKRENNFLTGDINKLVTIDSPHFGSFLADFAIALRDDLSPLIKDKFIEEARKKGFALDEGAVEDMQSMSPAIIYLNGIPTDPTSHSIVGDFVLDVDLSLVPGKIGIFYKVLKLFGFNTNVDIIPGASDTVVSVKSQRGGLISPTSSTFNHHHTDAVGESVANKAIELLNTPPDTPSFSTGFPVNKWPEF